MLATFAALAVLLTPGADAASVVRFVPKGSGWELQRNGKPYFVKGAGTHDELLPMVASLGANSVRTWGIGEGTGAVLDQAHKLGLSVCLGFWMRKNDGFDYKKPEDLDAQEAEVRKWVRRYKNHPAVLMWAMGNEQELGTPWPEVWKQTERLVRAAKEEDPNHPVITVVADMWPDKMKNLLEHVPSLDGLGVNSYSGLPSLMGRMQEWKKPVLITEFSFTLATEDPQMKWAGFIEPSSAQKAESIQKSFRDVIDAHPGRILGSYFFHFSKSGVGTSSLHTVMLNSGEKLAMVDVLAREWGGPTPQNLPPNLVRIAPGAPAQLVPGQPIRLDVRASDPDGDRVSLRWEILPNDPSKRFVGDFEQNLGVLAKGSFGGKTELKAPREPGLYRILVVARDGKGAAATDSWSFLVR